MLYVVTFGPSSPVTIFSHNISIISLKNIVYGTIFFHDMINQNRESFVTDDDGL